MKSRTGMHSSETELHLNLVEWLHRVGEPLYPVLRFVKHTPNEALSSSQDTRSVRQSNGTWRQVPISVLRGGRMGVRSGVFDFEFLAANATPLFVPPFRAVPDQTRLRAPGCYDGLAFELKSVGGRIDPEQDKWATYYATNAWYTAVFIGDWAPAARFLVTWVGGDPKRIEGLDT